MEKLNLRKVAEMSDREVYELSVLRPNDSKGIRGFMFPLKAFENTKEMSLCVCFIKSSIKN